MRGTVIDAFGIDAARSWWFRTACEHANRKRRAEHERRAAADGRQIADVRRRYGLGDGPYVVYPAITHPHKNHRLLLEVMARHWTDPTLRLVLLGGAGAADAEVGRTIADLGLGDRVVRPGRVPDADRDGLIAGGRRRSCSRAATRASARHSSRRWRSARLSSAATIRPSVRWPGGRDRAAATTSSVVGRARTTSNAGAPSCSPRDASASRTTHSAASGAALLDAYHRTLT